MTEGERWEKGNSTTIQPDGPWHDLVIYGHDNAGTRAFILPDWLIDAIIADYAAAARLVAWEAAMTDVSVINWTLSEDNAEDLHKQLAAVIAMTVQEQLDPLVSEQAHKLAVAEQALEVAHDWIDEQNNILAGDDLGCVVCNQRGYDGNGLKHTDDCVLIRARVALATLRAPARRGEEGMRYVVEFDAVLAFTPENDGKWIAKIYAFESDKGPDIPKRARKIALVGESLPEAAMQFITWLAAGAPDSTEAKARIAATAPAEGEGT